MPNYKNKYRGQTTRLKNWNYRSPAAYFITIVTKNRFPYFGEIADGQMLLSEIGNLVKTEWEKTFVIRADMNLTMGEYIVMPNHFHAIIIIGKNLYNSPRFIGRDAMHCVPTNGIQKNKFGPQSKNLASIIRGFKSAVTKHAHRLGYEFAWQPRFYDHVIRNKKSFNRISAYIRNNPINWGKDKFNNPKNKYYEI